MARFPKTLRSSQRGPKTGNGGRLPGDPSAYDREKPYLCAEERLSPTTIARKRTSPNPMGRRFTKFTTNYTGQIKIPHDIISAARESQDGRAHLDVGQIPED